MKKYLKTLLCLILALALVFAVAACGDDEVDNDDDDEEEAKEKDEKEKDEDNEDEKDDEDDDDKDDDKKSSSKERELVGKTKNEKAAEEAFYEMFEDQLSDHKKDVEDNLDMIIDDFDIPDECVDEYYEWFEELIDDYAKNVSVEVLSVEELDDEDLAYPTVLIEYEIGNPGPDGPGNKYFSDLVDLIQARDDYSDDEFAEELDGIMEDIMDKRDDIIAYSAKHMIENSIYMNKEDGEWVEGYVSNATYCDNCGLETDILYEYDGWYICEDCYYDEISVDVEEPDEMSSEVIYVYGSGLCEWCNEYTDELYGYDEWFICEDCYW